MPQIFNGQSLLQLKFNCGTNITTATVKKILWQNPNGTRGEWTVSSIDGTNILVYNVDVEDIIIAGVWTMQAYVEIGGLKGYGQIVSQAFTSNLNP